MSAAPVAVIDTLNSLLEAELNSVFRFMHDGSPYLSKATAEVRRPLQQMVEANQRHVAALSEMIESLGGLPVPRSISPEEQYLAYLSLKFLLPKLVDAKMLMIRRYEVALRTIETSAPREVVDLLNSLLAEDREHLQILQKATADVLAAK